MGAAWIAVVGSLGGAAVGGGLGIVAERLRWRATTRTRWLDLRRELAVRFLAATERVQKFAYALSMFAHDEPGGPTIRVTGAETYAEAFRQFSEAIVDADTIGVEIDLVGSTEERRAADRLRGAALKIGGGQPPAGGGADRADYNAALLAAYEEYMEARKSFLETVRRGLVPDAA